jgi:hypothetical protein
MTPKSVLSAALISTFLFNASTQPVMHKSRYPLAACNLNKEKDLN